MTRSRCALVALVAITGLLLASCMTGDEQTAFDKVNGERGARGTAGLNGHEQMVQKAQGWSQYLLNISGGACNTNTLHHSNLASNAPAGWRGLAENVGCAWGATPAQAVNTIHNAFMNSSGHRANILNRSYNYGGVGLAGAQVNGGWLVYETQEFAAL